MPNFGARSRRNLSTAHSDLQRLANEVIKYRDCSVLCGHRTKEEQTRAFEAGRSKARWGESLHNAMPSDAIDMVPYPVVWDNKESFIEFAGFVLGVAAMLDINISWGGHFKNFFDGPHFERNI